MPANSEAKRWKHFGKWIRGQRRAADLTQEQVAKRAGIHALQVGRIEKGESGTKRDTVMNLAHAIGADPIDALQNAGFAILPPYLEKRVGEMVELARETFTPKPKNLAEFLEALENMGLEQFAFSADKAALENYTPEDFEELLERIKADVEITIRRKRL